LSGGVKDEPAVITTFSCEGRGLSRVCRVGLRGSVSQFPAIRPRDPVAVNRSYRRPSSRKMRLTSIRK
jgi:hypothetical protein